MPDRWSAPLETFTTSRGDCEDYAIAKYVALTAAGVPAQDVKLVIVRNTAANEDHAVVAVRNGGDWIMLDNRWLTLVKDVDDAEDHSGVRTRRRRRAANSWPGAHCRGTAHVGAGFGRLLGLRYFDSAS